MRTKKMKKKWKWVRWQLQLEKKGVKHLWDDLCALMSSLDSAAFVLKPFFSYPTVLPFSFSCSLWSLMKQQMPCWISSTTAKKHSSPKCLERAASSGSSTLWMRETQTSENSASLRCWKLFEGSFHQSESNGIYISVRCNGIFIFVRDVVRSCVEVHVSIYLLNLSCRPWYDSTPDATKLDVTMNDYARILSWTNK